MARCPTKRILSRDEAIRVADSMGYPVVPYRCPNGNDHWHVGRSQKKAPEFHNHRDRWVNRKINQDLNEAEWEISTDN